MFADDILFQAKKDRFPDQGTYKLNYNRVEVKTMGCFNFKSDRSGHIEEAMVIGKEQPPLRNPNYTPIETKDRIANMYKALPEKPAKKVNLSPVTYDHLDSYNNTQVKKPNVYITPAKYKYNTFIDNAVKQSKHTPAPKYEVIKAQSSINKGPKTITMKRH